MLIYTIDRFLFLALLVPAFLSGWPSSKPFDHEIPLTIHENIIFITLSVNDSPATFIVDTGATVSLLDQEQASTYRFICHESQGKGKINGLAGVNSLLLASGIRVKHQDLRIKGFKFYVCNIDSLHEFLVKRNIHILGILGADFLISYNAVIDYKGKRLLLSTK